MKVRWLKDHTSEAPENDAPRADWQEAHKVGPVGSYSAGQVSDLHEDEVQAAIDAGLVELITDDPGYPQGRPLWTEVKVGEETGREEQATIEDRPVSKKTVSAQGEPVKATRKVPAQGGKKSHTMDPAKAAAGSAATK